MNYAIGIQQQGASSPPIYRAALDKVRSLALPRGAKIADVGGGGGSFSRLLVEAGYQVTLFDFTPDVFDGLIDVRSGNLNQNWDAKDGEFDAIISLEVIEHVENPRHFMREICRIAKPRSPVLISTPNQHSLSSKLCFLFRGEHQHFQESCYPAHISPLLKCDLLRISRECGFTDPEFSHTGSGRIPGTRLQWQNVLPFSRGQLFSDNVLFRCNAPS